MARGPLAKRSTRIWPARACTFSLAPEAPCDTCRSTGRVRYYGGTQSSGVGFLPMKNLTWLAVPTLALTVLFADCGGSNNGGGGGGGSAPSPPAGLTAAAVDQQVALAWSASATATSYHVKCGTVSGGPYTNVASPTTTTDTDSSLTNGTKYFYVVSAVNSFGESANSSEASATPLGATASVHVTVDVLDNRDRKSVV